MGMSSCSSTFCIMWTTSKFAGCIPKEHTRHTQITKEEIENRHISQKPATRTPIQLSITNGGLSNSGRIDDGTSSWTAGTSYQADLALFARFGAIVSVGIPSYIPFIHIWHYLTVVSIYVDSQESQTATLIQLHIVLLDQMPWPLWPQPPNCWSPQETFLQSEKASAADSSGSPTLEELMLLW